MIKNFRSLKIVNNDLREFETQTGYTWDENIGVDHIIFDYMFAPIGSDVDEMIDMSKELSKYAR